MWRIMKLTWILCVCFVCTLSANVMSQQKLNMNLGETSLKMVFEEIRKQTNKIIIYNDDRLALNKKVIADFKNMELEQLLNKVLTGSGLTYKFVDDYIVLIPMTEGASDNKKVVRIKGWVHDKSKQPLPGVTVSSFAAVSGIGVSFLLGTIIRTEHKGVLYELFYCIFAADTDYFDCIKCRVRQCRAGCIVCKRIENQSPCRTGKQKSKAIEKAHKRTGEISVYNSNCYYIVRFSW